MESETPITFSPKSVSVPQYYNRYHVIRVGLNIVGDSVEIGTKGSISEDLNLSMHSWHIVTCVYVCRQFCFVRANKVINHRVQIR